MRARPWFAASLVLVALSIALVAGGFLVATVEEGWGALAFFGLALFLPIPAALLFWAGTRVRRHGRLPPRVAAVLGAAAGALLAGMVHSQWLAPVRPTWRAELVPFMLNLSMLLLGYLGAWVDRPLGALLLVAGAAAGGTLAYLAARRVVPAAAA